MTLELPSVDSLYGYRLPFQIGLRVPVEAYNNFLENNGSTGYKLHWDNGDVYIVNMAIPEREAVVVRLINYFNVLNGSIDDDLPIDNTLRSFHYDPSNVRIKTAADIEICLHITLVQTPLNPGPPPGWLLQQYVRSVFGIKIYDKRKGSNHRSMKAKLWTRQLPAPAESTTSANPNLAGVSVLEWDFGTLLSNSNQPGDCTGPGLPNYTVSIPVSDVFWDPPIVAGVPNVAGYTVTVPNTVIAQNFVIDLYRLQHVVLKKQ
ncbi:9339_t:CDS:2 [Funneliformis caledonium]|uniref:9339_t:CDS:1 n=1 Tax=Funneliformis caledonium TaxID=1117310 RepID=A0A9N9EJW0_9GLOM|nr:9339_t:CDS:2 [Funneliformis caledonium]